MRFPSWITGLAASAALACASSVSLAQVGGTVKLDGQAPAPQQINVANVPACAQKHANNPLVDESLVVGADNGLANVVVSIKPDEGQQLPAPTNPNTEPAVLDQVGCQYVPHVIAMQVNQPMKVKNSDEFLHNVHTQPEKSDPINRAQPNKDPGMKVPSPTQVEYFHVKCDVHPWMSAWVAVLDNPYYAVSDKGGKFTLPAGLPDGDYNVHAWHEKLGEQDGKVTVKGGKGTVDFTFKQGGADAGPLPGAPAPVFVVTIGADGKKEATLRLGACPACAAKAAKAKAQVGAVVEAK